MTYLVDSSRRSFLKLGAQVGAGVVASFFVPVFSSPALAIPSAAVKEVKKVAFHNLHTDERLFVSFWREGRYDRSALEKINHILRDFRSGDVRPIHPRLIELLHDLQANLGNDNPVEIISGYRSPQTNAKLASRSSGVAHQSFHTKGMAIDIRIAGTPLTQIHKTALSMGRGGVGYYPESGFVHVDVGPKRRW